MKFTGALLVLSLAAGCLAGLEDVTSSVKLTSANFDSSIRGKNALVAFFAPWCGHCKSLAPAWQSLGKDFADEDSVLIGHLDADNAENRPVAERFDVKGYPTLKFFPADGSAPRDYNEGRTEEAFIDFINAEAGTHRTAGGLLNDLAGRLPDFDTLLTQFLGSTEEARAGIVAQAEKLAKTLKIPAEVTAANYYVKVFQKLAQSSDWAQTEFARLQKLASKRTAMAGKQLDDFQVRQNILQAFNSLKAGAESVLADAGASASSVSSRVVASASSIAGDGDFAGSASTAISQASGAAAGYANSVIASASGNVEGAASVVSASASSVYSAASAGAQRVVDEL